MLKGMLHRVVLFFLTIGLHTASSYTHWLRGGEELAKGYSFFLVNWFIVVIKAQHFHKTYR